jgi:hypothetical protein
VNVCHSDAVQTFSEKKQLDDQGNEQEVRDSLHASLVLAGDRIEALNELLFVPTIQGIHVPLSLGAPHEVTDKKGQRSLAFDVAVNTKVVEDCKQDKTGAFRNFVCELAIEYIDQKVRPICLRYVSPSLTPCCVR